MWKADHVKSPHALLRVLRERRERAEPSIEANGEFGVAICEVLDELIRRTQVIAAEYPENEAMTLRLVEEMPAVVEVLSALVHAQSALNTVISECIDAVGARRDPIVNFLARVRSEGYEVSDDWTVTEARHWPALDDTAHPDAFVQQEAEKTVRAERATAYQERLLRMAAAFEETRSEYTRRARDIIPTVLDG